MPSSPDAQRAPQENTHTQDPKDRKHRQKNFELLQIRRNAASLQRIETESSMRAPASLGGCDTCESLLGANAWIPGIDTSPHPHFDVGDCGLCRALPSVAKPCLTTLRQRDSNVHLRS